MNNYVGLFGLLILGTIMFVTQMFIRKSLWDLPMTLASFFCWIVAGMGFFHIAFSH